MLVVACLLAALAALLHVYIFVLESVRWTHPATRKVFGTSAETAEITRPMAYNQGFYNLFLALGTGVGVALLLAEAQPAAGTALVVMGAGSMLAAALVLVLSDRTKARAALVQGLLPALALLSLALA